MMTAGRIREENPSGWSDDEKYNGLPRFQKIWLDNAYEVKEKETRGRSCQQGFRALDYSYI